MDVFKTLLVMPGLITDLIQKFNIKRKIQTLQTKMDTLASREADIRRRLHTEERRPGKERKEEVNDWLKNFERLKSEVDKVGTSKLCCQIMSVGDLDNFITDVERLYEKGEFSEGLTLDVDETQAYPVPLEELMGQAFQSNLDKIWGHLMSEEDHIVGVQGMGGVGKTTLVKHTYNRIVNHRDTFSETPCWITVSQDFSVKKLQEAIAKHLNLKLEYENDNMIHVGKLCNELEKRLKSRKFVIILDDVWKTYPLENVGISLKRNGCKLILTSRSKDVCHQMNCDVIVEVGTLSEQEGWCLFRDNLKSSSLLSRDVEEVAQAVAKECAGLPLGIVVLSGIMKGVNDIKEWRITLKKLRESKFKAERMEDEVFKVLRFSYQRLSDYIMQRCFLHIALYPEDAKVEKDKLIQYFIDSRLIEREDTRRSEFDNGHLILNKLVRSCLLENEGSTVKMHDLLRDMVINITEGHFMVKTGQSLREIPAREEWTKSLEKVSLVNNNIEEISLDTFPQCPNISTLFLQRNPLRSISDSFFKHMQALQILNLSQTSIQELPNSFSDLENLTALHLRYCHELRSVPSLAKMKALRTLDLSGSRIQEIPEGIQRLYNLAYLDLSYTKDLKSKEWPSGILPQLLHLQHLNFMKGPKIVKADELMGLRKLESLFCNIDNEVEFSICMRYLQSRIPHFNDWGITKGKRFQRFKRYSYFKSLSIPHYRMEERGETCRLPDDVANLYIGNSTDMTSMCQWGTTFPKLKRCYIEFCSRMETLIDDSQQCNLFPELEVLNLWHLKGLRALISNSLQSAMAPGKSNLFSNLRDLNIYNCGTIKKLLTPPLLSLLTHLEKIRVGECSKLEEIIAVDHDPNISLPKLLELRLENLAQLKSICGAEWIVGCVSLQKLVIKSCPNLESIPIIMWHPLECGEEEDPLPTSLEHVLIEHVRGWNDTRWSKREGISDHWEWDKYIIREHDYDFIPIAEL